MKHIEVVAAVIYKDGEIFATQRGYGEFEGLWEFPGGKIEPGESCEVALVREIQEELGVDIKVGELICTTKYDYPSFHLTMNCFLCNIASGEIELREHPGLFQLIFADNGHCGNVSENGIGLHNMETRVSELGGSMRISLEKGFRIFISIPKSSSNL
jgi:8-oxo-dGTP diphosphatase